MNDKPRPSPPTTGQWKPGQSGNPGGRPKTKIFTEALKKLIAERGPDESANIIYSKMLTGDVSAWNAIADRVDGKVPQAVVGDDDHPPIKAIVTGVVRDGD